MIRHSFSSLSVKDNYDLVPIVDTAPWRMNTMERPPSEILLAILDRLAATFSLTSSEAAKLTLIDALLSEVVPHYPGLRTWKGEPL